MVRRFVTLDGDVRGEEEWDLKPTDRCFYCNRYLVGITPDEPCDTGLGGQHDFITLIHR